MRTSSGHWDDIRNFSGDHRSFLNPTCRVQMVPWYSMTNLYWLEVLESDIEVKGMFTHRDRAIHPNGRRSEQLTRRRPRVLAVKRTRGQNHARLLQHRVVQKNRTVLAVFLSFLLHLQNRPHLSNNTSSAMAMTPTERKARETIFCNGL